MKQPWQYKAAYWSLIAALLGYGFMNQSPALADSNPVGFYSDSRSIEDVREANYLKMHSIAQAASNDGLSIHVQGRCLQNCARPIDGAEPAVEISRATHGGSDEFETLVANINNSKPGERYAGRN